MRTTLPTAPLKDEHLRVVVPADMKRRLFDAAAVRGVSASQLVREGVALAVASAEEAPAAKTRV